MNGFFCEKKNGTEDFQDAMKIAAILDMYSGDRIFAGESRSVAGVCAVAGM